MKNTTLVILVLLGLLTCQSINAQTTIDFNSGTGLIDDVDYGSNEITVGNFKFTYNNATWFGTNYGNGSTMALQAVTASDAPGQSQSITVETNDGSEFDFQSFWLDIISFDGSENWTVEGFKNGVSIGTQVISVTGNSIVGYIQTVTLNPTFDNVDKVTITAGYTGFFEYDFFDDFVFGSPIIITCADPQIPTLTSTPATVCTGGTASLVITGTLNDATAWHIYTGSCGGTQIGTTVTGTFAIPGTITAPTTFFVRGESAGGCVTPSSCGTITITPQQLDDASFSYSAAEYGSNDADPTPTITGLAGGGFTSVPAGLSLNSTTGLIDLSASTTGSYTVTYTTAGTCPNSATCSLQITDLIICSAPTAQATSAVFGTETSSTLNLNGFTAPVGTADGYAIFINNTNSFTAPIDGDEPTGDLSWNNASQQAVYFGTSANPNITVSGLEPGTQYFFQIYAFNDCSFLESYETTGLSSSDTTALRELTITGIAGLNKVYNGTTAASAYGFSTLTGVLPGDNVSIVSSPVFTFATSNVGTGITINTTGYSITGTDAGKYTLTQPTLSADITAKGLTITGITGSDKVHDDTTAATATGTFILNGVESGDDVILGGSPVFTFASANVGTGITINTTGLTISGTDIGNYTLTQPTLSGDITAKELTITGITGSDKVYDDTTAATATGTFILNGVESGDDVILGGSPVFTFASANVGTGITINTTGLTISGTDIGNYTLTQPTLSGDITAKELTITGITGSDKVYDDTTAATATGTFILNGVESGDDVILGGSPVFTFASANVGTGITINTTGLTISGTDIGNYTLTQPTLSGDITAKELTITGITGSDKVYDDTTAATATGTFTLNGVESGDDVILGGSPVFTFASANVGTGITINTTGLTISGTDIGNYTLTQPTLSGDITAKELTITGITGSDKVYDDTTAATATGTFILNGVESGDDVILGGSPVFTFASANVGTGITINTTGLTISGTDIGNYTLTQPTLSGDITAKELTITGIAGLNKVYNGTTAANAFGFSTLTGVLPGDDVTIVSSPVFTFATSNVGTGITINTTGYSITGTDAGKYTLTQPTLSADITAKGLTITGLTGDNKVYDDTTAATATGTEALSGIIGADDVSLGGSPVFTFASANVGTGITITTSGYTISGTDSGNYTLTQPTLSGDITAKELTITGITGSDKVYDDTTAATATGTEALSGIIGADDVSLGGSPVFTFASANVGIGITITTSGYTISGADSGNYTLTQPTLSGDITAKELTITGIAGLNKVYNGTTAANAFGFSTLTGVLPGDDVTIVSSPVFTFATSNVGTGITINTTGYSITGTDAGKYTLTQPTLSADITAKGLTITGLTGDNKVYDDTTAATATGTEALSGIIGADDVSLGGSPVYSFASSDVGTGITINTTGYSITGTDSGNYTLTQPTLSADITAKGLTITGLTGDNKVYDGTTAATASGTAALVGVASGDDVILGGSPVFAFASANVGTGITITVTGYTVAGADIGNYTLTQPSLSANIGPDGELLTIYSFSSLDTNAVNTISMTTHFYGALDSLSNHPFSPTTIDRTGFLVGHSVGNEVFLEYSIQQVVDSINVLNGFELTDD